MTDLLHHYKDRDPIETIQIIEKFFNQKNINIKRISFHHSEIDTYSCTYGLYWDEQKILQCNGKGLTKLYSKASCYAELYERFCLYNLNNNNNMIMKNDIMNLRKKINNYYFLPTEKEMTNEEYLNNPYILNFLNLVLSKNNNINDFSSIFSNNKLIGLPYTDLTQTNNIKYQDFSFLFWEIGSTGLAAGNNLDEALVQGCSEMFERIIVEQFFYNIQEKYYNININTLNPIFQDKILKLQKLNYQVFVIDLSYNFELPVCLLLVYNNDNKVCYFKFGSHPIFDIALERCFTELYQGFDILPNHMNLQINFYKKELAYNYIFHSNTGILSKTCELVMPYYLINNLQNVDTYNNSYFLSSNSYDNFNLLNFIKKILKEKHYIFYWTDISLCSDIHTVHIYSENPILTLTISNSLKTIYNKFFILSDQKKEETFLLCQNIYNFINFIRFEDINFNKINILKNIKNFLNTLQNINDDIEVPLKYLILFFNDNIYNPYSFNMLNYDLNFYTNILYLLNQQYNKISFINRNLQKIYWNNYQNYNILKYTNQMSDEDIKNTFSQLHMKYINFNQYINTHDLNLYLIYYLYIELFKDIYTSDKYYNYLHIFI